jgi:DNA repair protein RecO (recombination protein O)
MEWTDEGIILSVRPHGETAAVVELLTRSHGRHSSLVYGGRSRRLRPTLQIGNHVDATWKARLADQLGHATIELRRGYASAAMQEPFALAGLSAIAALSRMLPARDPHPNLYEITLFVLGFLDDVTVWPALYVRWEIALLTELGFGLDLTSCAATGVKFDLGYVSPKSGRAVSRQAGEAYKDKLLVLPSFLTAERPSEVTTEAVLSGLALTEYFLERRVFHPREQPLPDVRQRLPRLMRRSMGNESLTD